MALLTNIIQDSFTQCADIAFVASNISHVYWHDGTLIWEKGTSATWIQNTAGMFSLTEYTPSVNMSVASFSRKMADMNTNYSTNWACGIYTKSGSGYPYTATPVLNSCSFGNFTNISFVFEQVYLSKNMYKVTKNYDIGSRPELTAGTTYYFVLAEKYPPNPFFSLSDGYSVGYTDDWRVSATASFDVTAASGNQLYLEVIAE